MIYYQITNEPDDVWEKSTHIADDPTNSDADRIVYKDTTPVNAGKTIHQQISMNDLIALWMGNARSIVRGNY